MAAEVMVGRGDWNGETSLHDNSSDDSATINVDFMLKKWFKCTADVKEEPMKENNEEERGKVKDGESDVAGKYKS
eukprot:scaffold37961_cov79-Cyclotella_meneghiniana.AAC.2